MHSSPRALQTVADGSPDTRVRPGSPPPVRGRLPKSRRMSSIDQPHRSAREAHRRRSRGHVFSGVFLASAFVGPFACERWQRPWEEDAAFSTSSSARFWMAKPPQSCDLDLHRGRPGRNTPSHIRPTFSDLEEAMKNVKSEGGMRRTRNARWILDPGAPRWSSSWRIGICNHAGDARSPGAAAEPVQGDAVGEHPGFSRLVLDFDQVPHWSVTLDGLEGTVTFRGSPLAARLPARFMTGSGAGAKSAVCFGLRRTGFTSRCGCDCVVEAYALPADGL